MIVCVSEVGVQTSSAIPEDEGVPVAGGTRNLRQ